MEIRLDTPSTGRQFEQWASIIERVTGEAFAVDELAHVIETDDRSAWLLAYRGDVAVGCGVGRPSSIARTLYAMARVLPEHRLRGIGTALYVALSEHARSRGDTSLFGRIREDDAESRRGLRRRGASSPDATNLLTAVRRPWRRRGIASALKREQAAQARELGIEKIYTGNDETNVGMRGVNARLGYRAAPTWILVSGPLAGARSS